jgi:hypothetical protein
MNHITQLYRYIKELVESDPLVNTVTKGEFDKIDLDKSNIFPLVHINVTGASFSNGQTVTFSVQVGCFSIRDENRQIHDDKFWDNDNEVDNLNDTMAVLNRMWTKMYTDFESNNITASENPSLDIVVHEYSNILDGWILNFDVEIPNIELSLCQ